jgi:Au+-exporting ATPase
MNLFSRKPAPAETQITVEGMSCGACQAHVAKALQSVAGVEKVAVDLKRGQANVTGNTDGAALVAAIEKAGYSARIG